MSSSRAVINARLASRLSGVLSDRSLETRRFSASTAIRAAGEISGPAASDRRPSVTSGSTPVVTGISNSDVSSSPSSTAACLRNGAVTTSDALLKAVPPSAPARPASRVSSIACFVVGSVPPATCSITFWSVSVPASSAPDLATRTAACFNPASSNSLAAAAAVPLRTRPPTPVNKSSAEDAVVPNTARLTSSIPSTAWRSRIPP